MEKIPIGAKVSGSYWNITLPILPKVHICTLLRQLWKVTTQQLIVFLTYTSAHFKGNTRTIFCTYFHYWYFVAPRPEKLKKLELKVLKKNHCIVTFILIFFGSIILSLKKITCRIPVYQYRLYSPGITPTLFLSPACSSKTNHGLWNLAQWIIVSTLSNWSLYLYFQLYFFHRWFIWQVPLL